MQRPPEQAMQTGSLSQDGSNAIAVVPLVAVKAVTGLTFLNDIGPGVCVQGPVPVQL